MSEICNKIPNDILSEENITKLYNKLYPFTQVDEIAKAEHVVNIHNNINRKTIEKKPLKCPRCNGELILRTATKGINAGNQFYGCSNYPKCRYIQNITDKTV